MTIEITQTSISYRGNGLTTTFSVPFPLLDKKHLEVVCLDQDGNPQYQKHEITFTSNNVTPTRDAKVVFSSPVPNKWEVILSRRIPITQDSIFYNQGPNSVKVIEDALDKTVMICQELATRLDDLPIDNLLSGYAELGDKIVDISARLRQTMPMAPSDGKTYAASGDQWKRIEINDGDPLVLDPEGYVVPTNRASYTPTPIWQVGLRYFSVDPNSVEGDGDTLFRIDSDGYCVGK